MRDIHFTADWHDGHRNIIAYAKRPFANVEEQREILVENFNARVKQNSLTYHVGDVALNERLVAPLIGRLNGEHILIPGNHDRCHSCHQKFKNAVKRYITYGFKEVVQETTLVVDVKLTLLLNHMPYVKDERHGERYSQFRPVDKGLWLVHGHIHQLWCMNGRQINCGVDRWDYAPVPLDTIVAIVRKHDSANAV
jgi:calcineurin-like phosphoesterase family protein